MPPTIALFLCGLFILWLFGAELKRRPNVSRALWIPLIWMMLIGSRFVSLWLNIAPPLGSMEEGSPVDRAVFLTLIVGGFMVLSRRRLNLSRLIGDNPWVFMFFFYSGVSILWSDFSFVSFKRWIKEIGNLLMILIVLSEKDPSEAVKTLIRRCSYVLIPLSVVLIKYYPDLGRQYALYTGEVRYIGVATSKNMFGMLCLVSGFYFFWNFLILWRNRKVPFKGKDFLIHVLFLGMTAWLFEKANSATALICFLVGICVLIGMGLQPIRRNLRHLGIYIFLFIFILIGLEFTSNISDIALSRLGRDETLTGRVDIWNEVFHMDLNSWVGTGYGSFWLGERLEEMWARHWWRPTGAHNGYLETYLNLGWIGIFFLAGVIISSFRKIKKRLVSDFEYGRFQMAFLIMALAFNLAESAFLGSILMWFIFLLIAVNVPREEVEAQS